MCGSSLASFSCAASSLPNEPLMNRGAVKSHADAYWYRPCRDGKVWLDSRTLDVSNELKSRGLSSSDWTAVFLNYDAQRYIDGLFLVRSALVSQLPGIQYYAPALPSSDCIPLQLWPGLNDCAHFASECLNAGGVHVSDLRVGDLIRKLRDRADTKTLAYFVDLASAKRIVDSGIMQVGDIVAFGTASKTFVHGHSTIYMGGGKVANHTHLNHPSFTGGGGYGSGVWQAYAAPSTKHPLIILIHFSDGDAIRPDAMVGWWKMTWRSATYYYYFEKNGRAFWGRQAPASRAQGPASYEGKGYWFDFNTGVKITWTMSGSLEVHTRNADRLTGTLNDGETITGTKM